MSAVQENTAWSVPVLLRRYAASDDEAVWSVPVLLRRYAASDDEAEAVGWMSEVTSWIRETFLDKNNGGSRPGTPNMRQSSRRLKRQRETSLEGGFNKRQGYCLILATVALATKMGEEEDGASNPGMEGLHNERGMSLVLVDSYRRMSPYERELFWSVLLSKLSPPALTMAVDCVANVRLTLTKCLKLLPYDIRSKGHVGEDLSTPEEELMTWDVGDRPLSDAGNPGGGAGRCRGGQIGVDFGVNLPEARAITMTVTMSAC